MPTPYFEVAHLTKHFSTDESTVAAIQDVSFSLQKGQFLSILGPSGCGKSTLFNLIAGLMQPDCGDIRLQGESMLLRPGLTGYMLQKDLLLPWRTIADNIVLSKTLHGTRRQAALKSAVSDIAACGLRDLLNRRPDECSGGQRQRVGIAQALLGDPEILVLDEPTAGLDPEERIRFRGIISDLSQQKLVLLSTHIVSDLEAVANEIILLRKGVVLEMQKPASLLEHLNGQVWLVTVPAADETALTKQYVCSNVMHTDGKSVIRLLSESAPRPDAVPTAPNMEDLYLYYFGR